MMDEAALEDLVRQIMAQGYDRVTAEDYAVLIGDRPVLDDAGNLLVIAGGHVIATLPHLSMFSVI